MLSRIVAEAEAWVERHTPQRARWLLVATLCQTPLGTEEEAGGKASGRPNYGQGGRLQKFQGKLFLYFQFKNFIRERHYLKLKFDLCNVHPSTLWRCGILESAMRRHFSV